jgi:hypothetical protein
VRQQCLGRRLAVPRRPFAVDQVRDRQRHLGDQRRPRRGSAVQRVGGTDHQPLGVVGAVEPAARPVRIGEVRLRQTDELGRGGQPRGVEVSWYSVSRPVASAA